ncbi:MAG TPA: NYN domain-containing protein [Candidatus Sabulitectum sp.]|nr:NYN domain-containing protein [Candidatus Sabulitectum sp.]
MGITMRKEPEHKSARVFIDGQNLYHQAKEAFSYFYPNYDVLKLSQLVCRAKGFSLSGIHFYTGVPRPQDDELWSRFWNRKLSRISRIARVFTPPIRYSMQTVTEKDGEGKAVEKKILVGREKGVDIRIAIDVLKACRTNACNAVVIFSQDQDLVEAVKEAKAIAKSNDRWFKIVSAFPVSSRSSNSRGINQTDWYRISREDYDKCLDTHSYLEVFSRK